VEQEQDGTTLSRRRVVTLGAMTAAGALGVGGLAGCGGSSSSSTSTSGSSGAAGGALAKISDVPVGGVFVTKDSSGAPVVLTQPTSGTIVGFSGKCVHAGCPVGDDGTHKGLKCPCHGSTYNATGKALTGPAAQASSPQLASYPVKVSGTDVVSG
jgi:cytochrome b6-f complex iron-sulfur subunit